MEVTKIIGELRKERDQIEEAIISLERLARGAGARRGRPPAWLSAAKSVGRRAGVKKKVAVGKARVAPEAEQK